MGSKIIRQICDNTNKNQKWKYDENTGAIWSLSEVDRKEKAKFCVSASAGTGRSDLKLNVCQRVKNDRKFDYSESGQVFFRTARSRKRVVFWDMVDDVLYLDSWRSEVFGTMKIN